MRASFVRFGVSLLSVGLLLCPVLAAEPEPVSGREGATKPAARTAGLFGSRGRMGQAMSKLNGGPSRTGETAGKSEKVPGRIGNGLFLNPPTVPEDTDADPKDPARDAGTKKSRESAEPRAGLLKKPDSRKRARGTGNDAPPPIVSEDGSEVTIPDVETPDEAAAKPQAPSASLLKFRWPFSRK